MAGVQNGRKINIENFSADEILVNNNNTEAYIKAEIGEKIYNIDGEPHVVIKFGNACVTTLTEEEANFPAAFLSVAASLSIPTLVSSSSTSSTQDEATHICGTPIAGAMNTAVQGMDGASLNRFQLYPAAVTPAATVIPMRSNIMTYGPYTSPNFFTSKGGCNVEQNTDLAPWIFGGYAAMNTAGDALCAAAATGLNEAENGSITLPGLPALQKLGSVQNGPNLTSINVSFGSSGITTNYNFQTFTPKFGDLTRSAVDQMKNVARNRQKQLQFLRNQAIMSHNINRKLKPINAKGKGAKDADKGLAQSKTLQRCLMGNMTDWYLQDGKPSQRTVVGIETLAKTSLELRYAYDQKAFMSLDGLFGPISKAGSGGLPQYSKYKNQQTTGQTPAPTSTSKSKASPLAAQPPLSNSSSGSSSSTSSNISMDQYNLDINQKYHDPLTNKVSSDNHHHDGSGAGHAIDLVGRDNTPPENGMIMNMQSQDDTNRYSEDYRFLGLRGPLVLHAWGYDTNGKPIPNASDTETNAGSGTFTSNQLKDKFLKDWLNKPKTWPVAPVDLRFDRERGMWVSPQPYKIVVAKLKENLEPKGTTQAYLINSGYGDPIYDKDGGEIIANGETSSNALIKVVDRLDQSYTKDTLVYAYYDTHKAEYIILSAPKELPVIMTGTANARFTPKDTNNISITVTEPCGPGWDKEPVVTLVTKIENPMGHGAESGDRVTVQRWYTTPSTGGSTSGTGGSTSNSGSSTDPYKYIVIGTGAPIGGGSTSST